MDRKIVLEDQRPRLLVCCEILAQIAVVAALAIFIAQYFFCHEKSLSRSMEPTITPGSVVFINRAAYSVSEPRRFDVIAFRRDDTDDSDVLIRRIIALPGETVRIYRGVVYINGEAQDLSGMISEITSDGIAEDGIRLDEDEYFVLGDMPANSEDSRSSTVGTVKSSQLIGKAWITFRTVTEFELIK